MRKTISLSFETSKEFEIFKKDFGVESHELLKILTKQIKRKKLRRLEIFKHKVKRF